VDYPCDERWLGEVTPAELARPTLVLGFVREQIDVGSCKAGKPDEGYEDENTDDDIQAGLSFISHHSMSKFRH
jgi:hypothetical protein